MNQYTFSFTER